MSAAASCSTNTMRHLRVVRCAEASPPAKRYVPRSREEVVSALREARRLGQLPGVHQPGDREEEARIHADVVLSLARLDRILELDSRAETVKVEPGVPLGALVRHLEARGFALHIGSDEPGRSVGSFAALGGAGAASHERGLFLDHVVACEQVSFDGQVRVIERPHGSASFARELRPTSAITTSLTLSIRRFSERAELLRRNTRRARSAAAFAALSAEQLRSERGAVLQCAQLVESYEGREPLAWGQVTSCYATPATPTRISLGALQRGKRALLSAALPRLSGRRGEQFLQALARGGPSYLSRGEFERERAVRLPDNGARVYRVVVREARYEPVFWGLYRSCREHCVDTRALSSQTIDVTGLRSRALGSGAEGPHCELRLTLRGSPSALNASALAPLVVRLDELCRQHGAERVLLLALAPALPRW